MKKNYLLKICLVCLLAGILSINPRHLLAKKSNQAVMKTTHFDIHYSESYTALARQIAKYSEEIVLEIQDILQYEINKSASIILSPAKTFESGTLFDIKNMYKHKKSNQIWLSFDGNYHDLKSTLSKKIVYYVLHQMFFGNKTGIKTNRLFNKILPESFLSGYAYYVAHGYDQDTDIFLRRLIIGKKIDELNIDSFYNLNSEKSAVSFVNFIVKKYNITKISSILKDARDLYDFKKSLIVNLGKEISKIEHEWQSYYLTRFNLIKKKSFSKNIKSFQADALFLGGMIQGDRLTYLDTEDCLKTVNLKSKDKKSYLKIDTGEVSDLLTNKRPFHSNGKNIVHVVNNNTISVYDIYNDSKVFNLKLPFLQVSNPAISKDSSLIVFTATTTLMQNIYVYNIKRKKLQQITNNRFIKSYPVFAAKNNSIIFLSNVNSRKYFSEKNMKVIRYNLKTNKSSVLVESGNIISIAISPDEKNLLFVSDVNGIYNVYCYDMLKSSIKRVSDSFLGVYSPAWLNNNKFAVINKEYAEAKILFLDKNSTYIDTKKMLTFDKKISYNKKLYFEDIEITEQSLVFQQKFNPKMLLIYDNSYSAELDYQVSDMFNLYSLNANLSAMYYRNSSDANSNSDYDDHEFDYNLDIEVKKYIIDFKIGTYRKSNPFTLNKTLTADDFKYNVFNEEKKIERIGALSNLSYPISDSIYFDYEVNLFKYERKNIEKIKDNIISHKIKIGYNNYKRLYYNTPYEGFKVEISLGVLNNYNSDYEDNRARVQEFDLNYALRLFDYSYISLKAFGGRIVEDQYNYFDYYLGGYKSLRAYENGEFFGNKMFFVSPEIGINLFNSVGAGFLGELSCNFLTFADVGSVYNGAFKYKNGETGLYEDFKVDFGVGLSIGINYASFLRLDYARPYDNKSFGTKKIQASFEINY